MSGIDHLGFIVAAYAVTAVALLGTIAVLVLNLRTQTRLLRQFDSRSDGA